MDLYQFIKEETGYSVDDSSLNLSLQKDLGLYGDEVYDFIMKFSSVFDIDLKEFHFNHYFNSEEDKVSLFLSSLFFKKRKKNLILNDLQKAITSKKLI